MVLNGFCIQKGKRGFNTLFYENKAIHSTIDPIKEACRIVDGQWQKNPFVICMGVGLGYTLDDLYDKMKAIHSRFHILGIFLDPKEKEIYDQNKKETLLSNHVSYALYDDRSAINQALEKMIKDPTQIERVESLILPSFKNLFNDRIQQTQTLITQLIRYQTQTIATQLLLGDLWFKNIVYNASMICEKAVDVRLTGDVVVVAAGPTLVGQKEFLQNIKGTVPIIALDTALQTLYEWDIVPDFIASCDAQFANYKDFFFMLRYHLKNPHIKKPVLLADITHYHGITRHFSKALFFQSDEVANFVSEMIILKDQSQKALPLLDSGGSVASFALCACRYLGASRLVLVGQDLSYHKITHSIGSITYNQSLYHSYRLKPIWNFYKRAVFNSDGMLNNLLHWLGDFFFYYKDVQGIQKDPQKRIANTEIFDNHHHHLKGSFDMTQSSFELGFYKQVIKNLNDFDKALESLLDSPDKIDKIIDSMGLEAQKTIQLLSVKMQLYKARAKKVDEKYYQNEMVKKLEKIKRVLLKTRLTK